jgi:uracil phosphoribosyltransferase
MPNIYPSTHPLVAHKLTKLRDKTTEPKKFRELVREIAALLTYEATADLITQPRTVQTPLAAIEGVEVMEKSVWCPFYAPGWGWWRVYGA